MDAHQPVTLKEGDRYPLGPPRYIPVVKLEIIRPCEGLVPGSTPGGDAKKENTMKSATFRNKLNSELFVCEDVRNVQVIDNVEYLVVHKQHNTRPFLMRKDALEKVEKKVLKSH